MADTSEIKEVESAVDKLLSTVGLLDVILGGLAVYWARLVWGASLTNLFPSTGTPTIDAILMSLAASLVGKLVILGTSLMMAMKFNVERHRRSTTGATTYERLTTAVTRLRNTFHLGPLQQTENVIDLAATYLHVVSPPLANRLERVHTASVIAYGSCIISLLYAIYFFRVKALALLAVASVAAIVSWLLGSLHLEDYLETLSISLDAATLKPREEKSHLGERNAGSDVQN